MTAVQWLLERMAQWEDEPAIVWRDREYTYRELLEAVDAWRCELDDAGVVPGTIVAFEGDYAPNECALSQRESPFRTVGTLTEYVLGLAGEVKADDGS